MSFAFFSYRQRSLLRGTLLVLGSLCSAFIISDFPNDRGTLGLLIPTVGAFLGLGDTLRCLQRSWTLYHAAVVVLIFTDILALVMILFLLLYPYAQWLL